MRNGKEWKALQFLNERCKLLKSKYIDGFF